MLQIRVLIILLFSCIMLQACSSTQTQEPQIDLTKGEFNDPDNEALRAAMLNFLKQTGAPVSSTYNFVRYDLNGDKRRDAIIMIKSPYGYWCGTHGCVMLIMKAHNKGFSLVNSIQPVREPVYISRTRINGWNNLIARVSGRKSNKAKDVALIFDGTSYPKDPSKLSEYPLNPANHPDFIRVLYDDGLY